MKFCQKIPGYFSKNRVFTVFIATESLWYLGGIAEKTCMREQKNLDTAVTVGSACLLCCFVG